MHLTRSHRRTAIRTSATQGMLCGVLLLAGCTGAPSPQSRLISVHNTLQVLGLGQMGAVSQGSIAEGNTQRYPVELTPQCYTFVAFGGDGVRDIELTVADANGQKVAGETVVDAQASLQFCPVIAGQYTIALRAVNGGGAFALSSWRGGTRSGVDIGSSGTASAGCEAPMPLVAGQATRGSTTHASNTQTGSCAGENASGNDVAYQFTLEHRQQVVIESTQEFDGVIYIRSSCDDSSSEVACNDDDGQPRHSRLQTVLEAGTYFVFVDGYGPSEEGGFSLTLTTTDVPSPNDVCQAPRAMSFGTPVNDQMGPTDVDVFQSTSCQATAGADHVYRLDVQGDERVQISQNAPDYDGVLYLRRACADDRSELQCNDDIGDEHHSRINEVLTAGTYYVISDGTVAGNVGSYEILAESAPLAGNGGAGDSCSNAVPLTPGTAVEGNTFQMRDDVAAPCGTPQDGYDAVYSLNVTARSRARLWLDEVDFGASSVIYVARNCAAPAAGASATNGMCQVGAVGEDKALEVTLDPGQWYVIVDSSRARAFGKFKLNAQLEDLAEMERICRGATALRGTGHQVINGTTSGQDRFHSSASCAEGSRSPENVYRLTLRRRAAVRAQVDTHEAFDASLHVRSTCADPSTERACSDDDAGGNNPMIDQVFDPGTYFFFVDGYRTGNSGAFTFDVTVTPQ